VPARLRLARSRPRLGPPEIWDTPGSAAFLASRSWPLCTSSTRSQHAITDFDTWRAAFARFGNARADGGVLAVRVYRPVDDDAYVLIDLDFATVGQAQQFQRFLGSRVWSTPDNAPALAGSPSTRILQAEPVSA
jgi:hypothetical protein